MKAKLVRRLLYPLHERLVGRPTFRLLSELDASQWHCPERIRALQASKLSRLLRRFAQRNSSFAKTLTDLGIDPAATDSFESLSRLPLLDKSTLRARCEEWSDRTIPGGVRPMSTAGSTGEPLTIYVDRTREAYDKAARMRTHRWFGVEPGDPEAYVWGAPIANRRQDRLRQVRDFFLNDLLLSAFDLSAERTRVYLRKMEAFNPVCVFGYPSSLVKLCEFGRRDRMWPRLRSLKVVFVTGETLDGQQRRCLEAFFEVPVANGYGGRDSGFCAHQCPSGRMHVTSEHIIMEIVDDAGRPLPHGESGEIVVTNLDNYATPMIRYRTGDVGRLLEETCPCGRGLEVMDVVAGRQTDHLVASDGSLRHALSIIYKLRELKAVRQFQICQRRDRSIEVRVVADSPLDEAVRRQVLRGIRECLGEPMNASVSAVEQIDVQPSGKFRYVVSEAVGG